MQRQIPWFERTFSTGHDPRLAAEIIARLDGAPARAAAAAHACSSERLVRSPGGTWSVHENIAHLEDLDRVLFMPRLEQFASGADVLQPADVTNATTNNANHHARSIDNVLAGFAASRRRITDHLDAVEPGRFADTALHERLGIRMSLMDLCVFIAEHDDSHLARIRELMSL